MQTHSLTPEAFAALGGPNLVYVREVLAGEVLTGENRAAMETFNLQPEQVLYAVHGADGARLAVLADRAQAYAAALAHELVPVAVH